MIIKKILLQFTDKNTQTLEKLQQYCDLKSNMKVTPAIMELINLGLKCHEKGYRLMDGELVRTQD